MARRKAKAERARRRGDWMIWYGNVHFQAKHGENQKEGQNLYLPDEINDDTSITTMII
jgi:hypothetical protein